ncbi:Plug domain-containing protein [Nibrella saemangeumensis]|uniref:Plug domain-containing protein n=1 Tax=Nibrella saemangeumensis TaxID=1084526 RepID=A0ABP8MW20_9BACT
MLFFTKRVRPLSACVAVALIAGVSVAFRLTNDEFIKRLMEQLDTYNRRFPKEKVYVQTDRTYYLPGETVWLKGYLFDGLSHEVDSISGVLYVDLIDPAARKLVMQAQLKAVGGQAPGQLTLPETVAPGSYLLRAYTGWMRNFSEDFYFTKSLVVLPPGGALSPTAAPTAARPDVQFMPEGGELVMGLDSRVAFKVVDATGRGMEAEGFVLNSRNDTIAGLSSMHLGMGAFKLKPEPDQTYTAYLRQGTEPYARYALPAARPQGYVLTVDNISNKASIRAFITNNKPASTAGEVTLVAQVRGTIIQVARGAVSKKSLLVQLPRDKFPDGIAQLTLFDETNTPVCERLVYTENGGKLTISVTPQKPSVKPREKVTMDVSVTDAQNKPVAANLSMAVTDVRQALEPDSNDATLVSHLLLTSDLKGTIEQSGYYFDPTKRDRLQKLDLLLMTQGWRRFTWPEVLAGNLAEPKYPVEPGLSLTGQVVRPNQKQAGKVRLTFMFLSRDSARSFLTEETNEAGFYGLYGLDFTDTTNVLIQAITQKGNRNLNLTLDQLVKPAVTLTQVPYNPLVVQRDELAEFRKRAGEYLEIERQIRRNREILLQEVKVKAKRIETDSRKIYNSADATVKVTQQLAGGAMSVLDLLRGRVAGLNISGSPMNPTVQIRGAANFSGVVEPLFLIDGMPVDKQAVLSLPVMDVDYIDVLKGAGAAIFGSRAGGGVINVMTKRGNPTYDPSQDKAEGILVAKLPGFTPVRQFYAPRYDESRPEHNRPDYRATLHWEPLIQTGADGKATISFFASDARTTLRIITEGATAEGLPGSGRQLMKVE